MTQVYYSNLKNKSTVSPLNKIKKLMNKCGSREIYSKGDLVAIKVHFGELGNTAFMRPVFIRPVIEQLLSLGAKPYLTDTNTLYPGMRTNSVDHLHNAHLNGFNYSTLQVPVIIADGLRGENIVDIPVPNGKILTSAKLAADIVHADALLIFSHFKGHGLTGFGGAIKNLSMGCAARAGKKVMHSASRPAVNPHKCTACGRCKNECQVRAITISHTATITDICTGCVRCIAVCPEKAIFTSYDNSSEQVQYMMAEYAAAVVKAFQKPVICINILTSIVPLCDCMPGNDAPVVQDLGFMASTDPVALDKASYDLVKHHCGGEDPFAARNGGFTGMPQLEHAVEMGLGNLEYKLEKID